ncbi:beta-N-acetylhexosaminidase [Neolewinella agarilytica]|uniref:beta-N-acetylhexosaminidase n=1 Tax=Neolewinella agarilytica TaxID=478744 RepID=UPI002354E66E|nr:family 20 glycosylhydrolase [Neolewinella agarilytica]
MLRFFFPLLLIFLLCTCGRAPKSELLVGKTLIIPQPLEQTEGQGHFAIAEDLVISVENETQGSLLVSFLDQVNDITGRRPGVMVKGDTKFRLTTDSSLPPEGYLLDVKPEEVEIKAADNAGFFYAIQTLHQLLPHPASGTPHPAPVTSHPASGTPHPSPALALPAVAIKDAPNFGWRGYMLDVSRHFFTVEEVKQVIDNIAELKMNRFHWHLTDDQGWRIEIKSYPKLTSVGAWRADRTNTDENISDWWGRAPLQPDEKPTYGGFYTQDEVREVVAYAKARYIEVIPEIDMPGHAQAAVAAYPEIGCVKALPAVATGGVFRYNTINPGKKETYAFAEAVLNEVMDLFPYDYLHIGGDECNKEQWKIDPDAQRMMQEQGLKTEEELQSYFIRRMEKIINARGKKMIGWDEILEGGLAPNAVVMSWRGEEGGIASAKAGHEVIMTPSKYTYLDLKQGHDDMEPNLGYSKAHLSTVYNYEVIPEGFTPEQAAMIKGIQANMWTESISDWGKYTYMTYPRLFAVAENAWTSPERKNWDDFIQRLLHANERLDGQGIRYAGSAFSPWIHHVGVGDGIEVRLETEANGLDVHYTLDGSVPDTSSAPYTMPFRIGPEGIVRAQSFINGEPVGYTASLDLPIHKAAGMAVADAEGKALPKLSNLQYARLTPVDTNWHKFPANEVTLTLQFDEPTEVSSLQFSTLRYTISGIYPPVEVEVLGAAAGANFSSLASLDQAAAAALQGRNKVSSQIDFPAAEVTRLRVKLKTFNSIPAGHHKAGSRARIYLDELVVE